MTITLTVEARERLEGELDELRAEDTEDAVVRQGAGGDPADLADNAQAIERAMIRRARISHIERMLADAVEPNATGPGAVAHDTVCVGVAVSVRYRGTGDVERYWVGDRDTRGEDIDVVSPSSPMGQALLGARLGDVVSFSAPAGRLEVEVVGVG